LKQAQKTKLERGGGHIDIISREKQELYRRAGRSRISFRGKKPPFSKD